MHYACNTAAMKVADTLDNYLSEVKFWGIIFVDVKIFFKTLMKIFLRSKNFKSVGHPHRFAAQWFSAEQSILKMKVQFLLSLELFFMKLSILKIL